jgi:hypothetical protein
MMGISDGSDLESVCVRGRVGGCYQIDIDRLLVSMDRIEIADDD